MFYGPGPDVVSTPGQFLRRVLSWMNGKIMCPESRKILPVGRWRRHLLINDPGGWRCGKHTAGAGAIVVPPRHPPC